MTDPTPEELAELADSPFYRELTSIVDSVPANKREIFIELIVSIARAVVASYEIDVAAAGE